MTVGTRNWQQLRASEQLFGGSLQSAPVGVGARRSGDEDQVLAGSELRMAESNGLADSPPDPIADHRSPYLLAD